MALQPRKLPRSIFVFVSRRGAPTGQGVAIVEPLQQISVPAALRAKWAVFGAARLAADRTGA
jgi:hypothetical protein